MNEVQEEWAMHVNTFALTLITKIITLVNKSEGGSGEGPNLTTYYLKSPLWLVYTVMLFSNMFKLSEIDH